MRIKLEPDGLFRASGSAGFLWNFSSLRTAEKKN